MPQNVLRKPYHPFGAFKVAEVTEFELSIGELTKENKQPRKTSGFRFSVLYVGHSSSHKPIFVFRVIRLQSA